MVAHADCKCPLQSTHCPRQSANRARWFAVSHPLSSLLNLATPALLLSNLAHSFVLHAY